MEKYLKCILAVAVCLVTLAPASASTVSQREYRRGYNDCIKGNYDQNQHGASYKRGCRVAENRLAKGKKPAAAK